MTKKAKQVWGIIWCVLGIVLFYFFILPTLKVPLEFAVFVYRANMETLWKGLNEYAENHQGRYPENLKDLYPDYIADENANIKYTYFASSVDLKSENSIVLKKTLSDGVLFVGADGVIYWERVGKDPIPCPEHLERREALKFIGKEDIIRSEKKSFVVFTIICGLGIFSVIGIGIVKITKSGD